MDNLTQLKKDINNIKEVFIDMYEYGVDNSNFLDRNRDLFEQWKRELGD